MKKAIALFVTLALIMIITILVAKSLEISQNSLSGIKTVKKINQVNYLVKDIGSILRQIIEMNKANKNEDMLRFLLELPLPLEEKEIKINLSFEMIDNKIDLNLMALGDVNRTKINDRNVTKVLEYLFSEYQLANYHTFIDLLDDTFDSDNVIKGSYDSEIVLDDKSFENGLIYDFAHFYQILDRYALLTKDVNIYKIPWEKIIYFGDGKTKRNVYVNFIDDTLKEYFKINLKADAYLDDEQLKGELNAEDISDFNLKVYKEGDSFVA